MSTNIYINCNILVTILTATDLLRSQPGEHVFVPVALRPEGGHHLPADVVGGEAAEVQVRHGHGARVSEPAATRDTRGM